MRKKALFICSIALILLALNFSLYGVERIDIEVAKRAAEYHGESTFEVDLKACDYELMYWPWGEPAAYVFTLIHQDDFYPEQILLDDTLCEGAYLVSLGKEDDGYDLMAQANRYFTVVVGATKDMPSLIKAYAGLPEHILFLAERGKFRNEIHWIYGGLFHTFMTTKKEKYDDTTLVTEIDLGKTFQLRELEEKKFGTIPTNIESQEWEPFFKLQKPKVSSENALLEPIDFYLKEGVNKLKVKESCSQGKEGCTPAAFVNCLIYLETQGQVSMMGNSLDELLFWVAICMETHDFFTVDTNIKSGARKFFRGLGYKSICETIFRDTVGDINFLELNAAEIHANSPVEIGGGGKETL